MASGKKPAEPQESVGGRTRQQWNKETQQLWKRMRKFYNRNNGDGKGVINYDFIDPMIHRRTEALLNSLQPVYDRYQERFAEIFIRPDDLGSEWIDLQIQPCNYTELDNRCYLLHGAAIWMLDRIMGQSDLRRELYLHLPRSEDFLMELDWPDLWDSQHHFGLIYSLQYVLYSRNRDIAGYEKTPSGIRRLTDAVTAERKQHADVPSRRDYEAIINLLPREEIDLALRHYEEYFWQWTDRLFQCIAPMLREIAELRDFLDAKEAEFSQMKEEQKELSGILNRKLKELRKEQKSHRNGNQNGNALLLQKPSPVLMQKPEPDMFSFSPTSALPGRFAHKGMPVGGADSFLEDPDLQSLKNLEDRLLALADEMKEKIERLQDLRIKKFEFMGEMVHTGRISPASCEEQYGADVAAAMTPIAIRDPYEACFALLYMIDNDYDLPWLYGTGVGIAQEIGESLPWGVVQYDETDDDIWYGDTPDPEYGPDDTDKAERTPGRTKSAKPPEFPDWYERKYLSRKGGSDSPRSLAQILYEETGCLMPRDMHRYDSRAELLRGYGLRSKDAAMMLTCMNALGNARRIGEAMNFDPRYMHYLDVGEEAYLAEKEQAPAKPEDLTERIAEQQKEIKRLRETLYHAEKAGREARKELETERKTAALERRELADLRELVFNLENAEEEQPAPKPDIVFPYEVQKETLIFGGHDTWEKAIKPMLTGNVRFISKELTFDTAIIRHAEVIWVQTNAMSHTQYYRVVDTARQYKKPVRYFTNASAEKCAVQVAENDN